MVISNLRLLTGLSTEVLKRKKPAQCPLRANTLVKTGLSKLCRPIYWVMGVERMGREETQRCSYCLKKLPLRLESGSTWTQVQGRWGTWRVNEEWVCWQGEAVWEGKNLEKTMIRFYQEYSNYEVNQLLLHQMGELLFVQDVCTKHFFKEG